MGCGIKYSIVTFGCRVNQADSLRLEEDLRARGAVEAPPASADLVIVNTCSVTASADQGARQAIRRIARENPSARIVATGCYATRQPDEVAALPGVLRIVRNDDKLRTIRLLEENGELTTADRFGRGDGACGAACLDGGDPCTPPSSLHYARASTRTPFRVLEPGVAGRTAFTLRVQTGCEERCAYCIIPRTRGQSRSLPVEAVLGEATRVADAGFKEIALTGVHLGSYGSDLTPRRSLLELLSALEAIPGDVTFRISSLEPMDCTDEIVDLVARSDGGLAPHFHLPLQHASDRMLRLMQRPYTLDYYRALVDGIVERLPHASIGSDIIVGFPGESDADFACTVDYLPASPLSHVHVFPYSDRPGTAASMMLDKVNGAVIRERGARIRAIAAELSRRFRDRQRGTVRPGLTLEDGTLVVTDNYLKVRIPPGRKRNERVTVTID